MWDHFREPQHDLKGQEQGGGAAGGQEHLDGEKERDCPEDGRDGGGRAPDREGEELREEDPGHGAETSGVTEADEDAGEDGE